MTLKKLAVVGAVVAVGVYIYHEHTGTVPFVPDPWDGEGLAHAEDLVEQARKTRIGELVSGTVDGWYSAQGESLRYHGAYQGGKRCGAWEYSLKGTTWRGSYEEGIRDGIWSQFGAWGTMVARVRFKDGRIAKHLPVGESQRLWRDGQGGGEPGGPLGREAPPPQRIQVGDRIRVVAPSASVKRGNEVLGSIGRDTVWTVRRLQNGWIGIELPWRSGQEIGWVHPTKVERVDGGVSETWDDQALRSLESLPRTWPRACGAITGHMMSRTETEKGWVKCEGYVLDRERHGKWVYSLDEKKWFEGFYVNGEHRGTWLQWDSNGVLVGKRDFESVDVTELEKWQGAWGNWEKSRQRLR